MKTTISIIAGIIFGFAGTAMAFECPREMTDDNCERAKAEAAGKSASIEAPTQMALNPPSVLVCNKHTCMRCSDFDQRGFPTCKIEDQASTEAPTQMAMGETITITEQRPDGLYVCTHKMGTASPYDSCEKVEEASAGGNTQMAAMPGYYEDRDDGTYFCPHLSDTNQCVKVKDKSASAEAPTMMAYRPCHPSVPEELCRAAQDRAQAGDWMKSGGNTQLAGYFVEEREDGKYGCIERQHKPPKCQKLSNQASATPPTMLADGGCYQNDDGSYTCYGEDGSVIQAGSEPATMMASGEVIHCDAGLCYTCDSSGSCRDIDSGSASAEQRTMMAASGEVIHCDAGLCYTCDSSGSCRDIDSGSASAEQRTMMASGEVIHCDAGLCYTCDSSGSCRDIDSGSASAEQRTMMAASGEVIHCDAGLCYTCDSSGSCRDIDSGSASAKQQTMHASLRLGDPNPDSLCGGTDPWSCFNGTDTSPVLRDVSIFAAMYGK